MIIITSLINFWDDRKKMPGLAGYLSKEATSTTCQEENHIIVWFLDFSSLTVNTILLPRPASPVLSFGP